MLRNVATGRTLVRLQLEPFVFVFILLYIVFFPSMPPITNVAFSLSLNPLLFFICCVLLQYDSNASFFFYECCVFFQLESNFVLYLLRFVTVASFLLSLPYLSTTNCLRNLVSFVS